MKKFKITANISYEVYVDDSEDAEKQADLIEKDIKDMANVYWDLKINIDSNSVEEQ